MTSVRERVAEALSTLERKGTRRTREGYARFGIVAPKAFGVPMGEIQRLGKQLGRDHRLAQPLWDTGWYEARLLVAYVADPAGLTSAEMDRWTRDFDDWGITDTLCFVLFDRSPHAWRKIALWSRRKGEFVRRAGFALLASVALHDKGAPDARFLRGLALIEAAATDDRNVVQKAVNWALRAIGGRNPALNVAAIKASQRLAASEDATARWVGKDALRAFASPAMKKRVARGAKG